MHDCVGVSQEHVVGRVHAGAGDVVDSGGSCVGYAVRGCPIRTHVGATATSPGPIATRPVLVCLCVCVCVCVCVFGWWVHLCLIVLGLLPTGSAD